MKKISLEINGILFDGLSIPENYHEMLAGQEEKTRMEDREGMIYVFSKDCKQSFVNGNCHLDLDVIMVDAHETITAVHTMKKLTVKDGENVIELRKNLTAYSSPAPYRYVFELKSGAAKQLGAKAGDRLDVDYYQLNSFRNAENIRYAFQLKKVVPKKDWIAPLLQRMEKIISLPDPVRELNLEFVGGQHEEAILLAAGWMKLDGIDTEKSENVWLQKEIRTTGQHCLARVCISVKGHFRHLYFLALSDDGAYLPIDENTGFGNAVEAIRPDFVKSLIKKQPQTMEEELEKVIYKLTNPSVKDEWSEHQKKFYIWGREFSRRGEKSKYYNYRLLNGMLRFDDFCDYDFALNGALCAAAELKYRWAIAKLVILSLTRVSGSKNPSFWNDLGVALDSMDEKEAALCCFANAWNLEFDSLYANNLWLMGNAIIPDLLKIQNWDSLFAVASIMLSAISDRATVKQQVEVLCIVGLIYENRNDLEEAETYYDAAYDTYKRKGGGKKSFQALRWDFPVLYQALMRVKMNGRGSSREYADAQLKSFPATPLESGYNGRLPVEYVEGDGHGDHWRCVIAESQMKDPEKFFSVMIREGSPDCKGVELPEYERGTEYFTQGFGFRYCAKDDSASPIESYFLIGMPEKGDAHQFASAFPVFRKGCGSSIICPLHSVNVWGNAVEATVEFNLRGESGINSLAFFLPDYCSQIPRLRPDHAYRVELGAFAYSVNRFKEREFKIGKGLMLEEEKLRLRKEGKDDNIDSVSIRMSSDFRNLSRSFNGWADDISVIAPVERIEKFSFLGTKCLALWVKFDERGADMTLPVFLKEENLSDGYCPQIGDVIECCCWLQGWVHESHDLSDAIGASEQEANSEENDDDIPDFENALFAGVRGTGYDLDELAVRALKQKGKVDDLCCCPEALPGDAEFSCRVNGSVKFVKIMTGYFDNEDQCQDAWMKFRTRTVPRPDGKPVFLLSVVGIKLGDDHYKIYYNGFSRLNPALDKNEDELDLERIQDVLQFTSQEMAEIIAEAWRNLDASRLKEILAEDYEYNSLWVFETMHGADQYQEYLGKKFQSMCDGNSKPVVSAVRNDDHHVEIELQQSIGGKTNTMMLQFEIKNGKIISGWMTEPSFRCIE